jgi:carbon monoxide dehydrogenase subunit G
MNLDIGGEERFSVGGDRLWSALNDPAVLTRCIPGCRQMTPDGEDRFRVVLDLKVAAVGGSFEGTITLSDKEPPTRCRLTVTGAGTLGHGTGHATFSLSTEADGVTTMRYSGGGEIGGPAVGVGQRIVKGVAKHLIGRFFTALRREVGEPAAVAPHEPLGPRA